MGVDMVELDVRRTKDGVLILMHDETVDRTSSGTGSVTELSFGYIETLRLRAGAGGQHSAITGERIPTLDQVMEVVRGKILVNIDAKEDVFSDVVLELESLGILGHVVMKLEVPPDDPQLHSVAFIGKTHFMPKITQGDQPLSVIAPKYSFTEPVAYELKFESEDFVIDGRATIEELGARIWVNTLEPHKCAFHDDQRALLDPDAHWGRLIDLGINMIQTDYPKELIDYLEQRQ